MTTDADRTMAERVLERAGGALTVDDILILRAAAVWHRAQWELSGEREEGLGGRQKAPTLSPEEKRALKTVGMAQRPKREEGWGNVYKLDYVPVRAQLDRAEVAAGYLYTFHGLAALGEAESFMSMGEDPLGPTAIVMLWNRLAEGSSDPDIQLTDDESAWTSCSLDKDDSKREE